MKLSFDFLIPKSVRLYRWGMREEEGRDGDNMVWLSNKKNNFQLRYTLLSGGLENVNFI